MHICSLPWYYLPYQFVFILRVGSSSKSYALPYAFELYLTKIYSVDFLTLQCNYRTNRKFSRQWLRSPKLDGWSALVYTRPTGQLLKRSFLCLYSCPILSYMQGQGFCSQQWFWCMPEGAEMEACFLIQMNWKLFITLSKNESSNI